MTLTPFYLIHNLKRLSFAAVKVTDGRIAPLARLPRLEELNFPAAVFKTEQIAWLTARIGDRVKSNVLRPYIQLETGIQGEGNLRLNALVTGKWKPFLDSNKQPDRLQKCVDASEALVERYRANPDEPEPA